MKPHEMGALRKFSLKAFLIVIGSAGLVFALIVIGLLAAFAIFNLTGFLGLSKDTKAQADIAGLKTSLSIYQQKNHELPTTEQGLAALVTRPSVAPIPDHWEQTMDTVILDPWGNPYQYQRPGKHNPDGFDVYSMGPDGKVGTADDIGNWK